MSHASQHPGDDAVTNGIARPPLLYLACLFLGITLERLQPLSLAFSMDDPVRLTLGAGLIAAGLAVMVAGVRNFSRAATPVRSNQPVRTLVTTGIHGWSRNPIYVGMFLLYAGIGLAAGSQWILFLALPLVIILRYGVVAREEAYLERRFGDDYRNYKARVRRWL